MDLKSGETYWTQMDPPPEAFRMLDRDLSCDVAIIGAGITGALLAYYLINAGLHTIVLDRRPIALGSTSASTGLLQYEIDTPLVELAARRGKADATRAYQLCAQALEKFPSLVEALGDSSGLAAKQSLYLAAKPKDIPTFHEEQIARREAGLDVHFLSADQLQDQFAIDRPAALLSHYALQVDPYRLTQNLIHHAHKKGLAVFTDTNIIDYTPDHATVTLKTVQGPRIRATHVIFATGYETPAFLHARVALKSTYALVTQPIAGTLGPLENCLIWEAARPYLYARTTADRRIMIGGEDIDTPDPNIRDALLPEKLHALARKCHALFPSLDFTPAAGWAGTFAETPDGLPYIGTHPEFPRGYFALGYGGNGITFSLIAAEIIRDALLACPNPDAHLFRFNR